MNAKLMMALVASAMAFGAFAQEAKAPQGVKEKEDDSFISTEFGLSFDSKFMSYGLVDNNDPIVTPSASMTLWEHFTFSVEALFDTTKYGRERRGGYGNRAGKYMELDPGASIDWSFSKDDYDWLPTKFDVSLGYMYEYHPRSMGGGTGEPGDDTQFITLDIECPDLWLEPVLSFERDIDRDNGTYVNLEIGHTIGLIGDDDDPTLALKPSIAQGIGNTQRTRGYGIAEDHGGFMDTTLKVELTWKIREFLELSGYVAYYDYIFDSTLREGAREYTGKSKRGSDESYHFVGGVALKASF